MTKKKEYEVWKHILDTFDQGEQVETPHGLATVYMDNGEYVEVALKLETHHVQPYLPLTIIVPISRKLIRRLKK